MQIEKLTIINAWDQSIIGTITDPLEMRSFFKSEMLAAEQDFYFEEKQYYIEEVYLMFAENGLYELLLSVELP